MKGRQYIYVLGYGVKGYEISSQQTCSLRNGLWGWMEWVSGV